MNGDNLRIIEKPSKGGIAFTAYSGDARRGTLRCHYAWHNNLSFDELALPRGGARTAIADRFGAALREYCAARNGMVFTFSKNGERSRNDLLVRAGFVVKKRREYFWRNLKNYHSPYRVPFHYRSLSDLGKNEFAAIFAKAVKGDPFEQEFFLTDASRRRELPELVKHAGAKFDGARWKAAYVDGEPVGIVLPQEFPDAETLGTLFYIAILPQHRGKRYGRALHAAGLEDLSVHGIMRYLGCTDARNAAMLRIFRANGCRRKTTQMFWGAA